MKRLILAATVAGFGLAIQLPAEAMSIAPIGQGDSGITLVAQGCGPGGHRDGFGHCRSNFRPRFARRCPPRMALDRFGHCR